jgi:hypothetical protein
LSRSSLIDGPLAFGPATNVAAEQERAVLFDQKRQLMPARTLLLRTVDHASAG